MKVFKDKIELLVVGMIMIYASFFIYYMLTKHYSFMTYMLDLGVYDHNLWLVLNYGDPNFPLGMIHQSQLLYLLIPLYAINPKAETLLIIQAFIVPLGALFLYKLAKREIGSNLTALVLAILYLLYPPLHGVSQFDFHLEAFLPTLFLAAFYYWIEGWRRYLVFITLLLLTMDFASYLTLVFGLYLFLKEVRNVHIAQSKLKVMVPLNKPMRGAIITIILSLIFGVVHYSSIAHQQMLSSLVHEVNVSSIALQDRIEYVTKLYGPLAFIPLMSSSQLMALPWLSFVFLTSSREHVQIYNQYPSFIIPFIFIGVVQVMKSLSQDKRLILKLLLLMIFTTIIYFSMMDPVFVNRYEPITPRWPSITDKDRTLAEIIKMIPSNASVLTQNNIAPHLTNRKDISIGSITSEPDYILIDKSHFSYDEPNIKPAPAQVLPKLLSTGRYYLKAKSGSIELYEKVK